MVTVGGEAYSSVGSVFGACVNLDSINSSFTLIYYIFYKIRLTSVGIKWSDFVKFPLKFKDWH
jgi:hypothetical protein